MALLAIETSGPVGTVALATDSGQWQREIPSPRDQAERLVPLIDELLSDGGVELAQLQAIVFGQGPGSFTGLRMAVAVSQGLAIAAGLRLVAVSSLQATAQHVWRENGHTEVLVCVDARMEEIYSAAFRLHDGIMRAIGQERLSRPEQIEVMTSSGWVIAGSAVSSYASTLAPVARSARAMLPDARAEALDLLPQANAEIAAGRTLDPESARPIYLRESTAWQTRT